MNKKINLIINTMTILLLLASGIVAVLALNKNDLGVIKIFQYSIILPNSDNKDTKTKTSDLVVAKEVGISQLKKDTIIAYMDTENNITMQKIGRITHIKITKSGAYIYEVNNKNIDSSCVLGIYTTNIKIIGKLVQILLTRDGILILLVTPLLIITIYRLFYFVNHIDKND